MAWNVRTLDVGNGPKITSSCYGFDKAWATAYDNPPLFHPSVLGIMDPMARLQKPPAFAVFDGYEDTVDDGSGGDEVPERGCAKKRKLTVEQAKTLEISFESDNKLEAERKQKLAKDLGLHPRQVAVWFQNRRARWKTKRLQQEYVTLKCDYDAVVAESEHLKAEVKRLTKELQIKQGDNNNIIIINSNINRKVDDDEKEDDHNNSNRKDEEINKNNQISNNNNKDHQSNNTTTTNNNNNKDHQSNNTTTNNNNNNNSSSNNYSNKVHQETRNYPAPDYKVEEEAIMMQHWETAAMLKAASKTESSKESLMSTANSDQSSDLNIQSEPYLGIFTCTDQDELWVFNSF